MKVDLQRMDDAYTQLINLQRQLFAVESEIQRALHVLSRQRFGSAAEAAAISDSLVSQLKAVERRADGAGHLAQALRSASDQYWQCEGEARECSENTPGVHFYARAYKSLEFISLVPRIKEKEIIHRYIMPFIVTGKKGTT